MSERYRGDLAEPGPLLYDCCSLRMPLKGISRGLFRVTDDTVRNAGVKWWSNSG